MKTRNLSTTLKGKKSGWVAVNEQNEIVERGQSFAELAKKVEKTSKKLTIVPVTEDYSSVFTIRVTQNE